MMTTNAIGKSHPGDGAMATVLVATVLVVTVLVATVWAATVLVIAYGKGW